MATRYIFHEMLIMSALYKICCHS